MAEMSRGLAVMWLVGGHPVYEYSYPVRMQILNYFFKIDSPPGFSLMA